jgi:hypothetical protein
MPNGDDKNLVRLAMSIAVYHQRFGVWPTHARLKAPYFWDIAHIVGPDGLARLAELMELRTTKNTGDGTGISVGGSRGVQQYELVDHDRLSNDSLEATWDWLALERSE